MPTPRLPAGGAYSTATSTMVPWSCAPRRKVTDPELGTEAPGNERHSIRSLGTSLVISASHSTVLPPGPFAHQTERPSPVTLTDSRCFITVDRFSKFRQKAYNSSGALLMVITRVVRWPL